MLSSRLSRLPVGAALLLAGCATPAAVPTTVETTGMPNTELALRRAMDQVNADMGNLGGLRPEAANAASVATATTTGQPLLLANLPSTQEPVAAPLSLAPPPQPPPSSVANAALAPASAPIPLHPAPGGSLPVVPAELEKQLAFTWNGPLDDAVKKLGSAIGYEVTVFGPANTRPLAVVVSVSGTAVEVLRAVGIEAGRWATVSVDPLHHQIAVVHHV